MPDRGYYRMARGWMDSAMFANEPLCERGAWIWLIENAAYSPRQVRIGSTMVEVGRGQLVASLRYLATAWRWHKNKVDRFLKVLQGAKALALAKYGENGTGISIITLCNYDQYQSTRDSDGTTAGQPRDSDGTKKKEGLKKVKEEEDSMLAEFEVWWAAYPRKVAKPDAFRAYCKARKKADAATLLAGVQFYRTRKPDYADWAYPASWLNKDRWLDQPDSSPANPSAAGSTPRDPDTELKAQARAIARGLACPSATSNRVEVMVSRGYLTRQEADKWLAA